MVGLNAYEIANMSDEQVLAMNAYNPVARAVASGQRFTKSITGVETDIFASIPILAKQVEAVKDGDLSCAEATLAAQANTLDLMFNSLVCKAANSQLMSHFETYMRLALKAQSQCRTTYEALAEIRNPRSMAFIKQQNIGMNQQVNNDATPCAHEKSINPSNELLEEQDGERLDTRTTGTAVKTDQELETVEAINRGQDS
jgi:hypothetical protein